MNNNDTFNLEHDIESQEKTIINNNSYDSDIELRIMIPSSYPDSNSNSEIISPIKITNQFKKSKSYPNEKIFFNKTPPKDKSNAKLNICSQIDSINDITINDIVTNDWKKTNTSETLIENKSNLDVIIGKFNRLCGWMHTITNKINKPELINKLISIILHIFIMIVFEIYFYFNYVVWIEKEEFLKQIDKYLEQLNSLPLDSTQRQLISHIINSNGFDSNLFIDYLYENYKDSMEKQKKILHKLLIKACGMGGIVGLTLLILFIFGLYYRRKIKWNWIWIENLLMFILLGVFEYFFFMQIILKFSPITDAEIKYYVGNEIFNYFNSTR